MQFERTLPNNVTLRKKFSLPAPPNEKDNYVAQMEVDFRNDGAAVYSNPGYFVALGSAAPIHRNDMPNYTRLTWCINGKTKSTDVSWFAAQNYPFVGVQKRAAQQFFEEKVERRGMGRREQPIFHHPHHAARTPKRPRFGRSVSRRARKVTVNRSTAIEGAMGMPGFTVQPGQTATVQFQLYARSETLPSPRETRRTTKPRSWISGCGNWSARRC